MTCSALCRRPLNPALAVAGADDASELGFSFLPVPVTLTLSLPAAAPAIRRHSSLSGYAGLAGRLKGAHMADDTHPLVGLIASWLNEDDGPSRAPFRGKVIAALPGIDSLLLVEKIPRASDDEPPGMLVLSAMQAGLQFYATIDAEQRAYDWVMADPKRVVSLVPPKR